MSGRPKTVTAEEALAQVRPGMLVASGGLSAEPAALLAALGRRAEDVAPVTLLAGMMLDGYQALAPHLGNAIKLESWFMPQTALGDVGLGPNVDFLPMTWTQTCRYVLTLDIDICLLQVSPADENGNHSMGISASLNPYLVERSRVVIAQVNEQMPYTLGSSTIHESKIDYVVEATAPLRAYPHRAPDELDARIGAAVADLIADHAVIQCGIGTIPDAATMALAESGRTGLSLTSMLTDAGRALIESGACVGDGPAAVVGEVVGSQDLYRWVDRNPAVNLLEGLKTHSLLALASRESFVSINSTLEVDLFGQLNSEVLRSGQAGGIGGSVDFMMGAQLPGNTSIVALPSTTSRGQSRIVPTINRGIVTAPRTLVQYVVTEYGVADLRYLSASRRAEALAGISHPEHRDELMKAAKSLTRVG